MQNSEDTLKTLLDQVDKTYSQNVTDFRGRCIDKRHVKYYLQSSWHRITQLVELVGDCGAEKKILDIGMGYGFYDIILKEHYGLDVTGLELEENIPAYSLLPKAHGISVIAGHLGMNPSPVKDNSFDIIILAEVIEHLRISPLRAMKEIYRMLKPGGTLFLTTPNIARLPNIVSLMISFPSLISQKMKRLHKNCMNPYKLI